MNSLNGLTNLNDLNDWIALDASAPSHSPQDLNQSYIQLKPSLPSSLPTGFDLSVSQGFDSPEDLSFISAQPFGFSEYDSFDLVEERGLDENHVFEFLTYCLNSHIPIRNLSGVTIESNICMISFDQGEVIKSVESLKALMLVLKDQSKINNLFFYNCKFNAKTFPCFVEGLKTLDQVEKLIFEGCSFSVEELPSLADSIASLPKLNSLKILDQLVDTHFLKQFRHVLIDNMKLRELSFCNCKIDHETARTLSKFVKCPNLSKLFLDKNPLKEEGIDSLFELIQSHDQMTHLYFSDCQLDNKSLMKLGNILALHSQPVNLYLENNDFSEEGLNELLARGLSISHLSVNHNKNLKHFNFLENLLRHPTLKFIQISSQFLTDENLKDLVSLPLHLPKRDIKMEIDFQQPTFDTLKVELFERLKKLLLPQIHIKKLLTLEQLTEVIGTLLYPTQEVLELILEFKDKQQRQPLFTLLLETVYFIQPISQDGNCLFASISQVLNRWNAVTLREETIKVIKDQPQDFKSFLLEEEHDIQDLEERFKEYVANMSQQGKWGGNIELNAIAKLLKQHNIDRPIYIFDLASPPSVANDKFVISDLLIFGGDCKGEPICLYRQYERHYDALIPRRKRIKRSADAMIQE